MVKDVSDRMRKGRKAFEELVGQADLLSQENLPGISRFPRSVERVGEVMEIDNVLS